MKTKLIILLSLFLITGFSYKLQAQVTIGSNVAPTPGALLDIKDQAPVGGGVSATTGGLLLPRVSLTNKGALTPLAPVASNQVLKGLTVYNLNVTAELVEGVYTWNGSTWTLVTDAGTNGIVSAANGTLKLGGSLTETTEIALGGNNLNLTTTTTGKVGIGSAVSNTDASKLQVTGGATIAGEITLPTLKTSKPLVPGKGYILSTNDGTGKLEWAENISVTPPIIGTLGAGINSSIDTPNRWIGASIKLPPGAWIVQSSIVLYVDGGMPTNRVTVRNTINNQNVDVVTGSTALWARLLWCDAENSGTKTPDAETANGGGGGFVSGAVTAPLEFGSAAGNTLINNRSGAEKTYYLNYAYSTVNNGNAAGNPVGTKLWKNLGAGGENLIIAFPVASK